MKDIIIIGAGGVGRETAMLIEDINNVGEPVWNILGFVDDNPEIQGKIINGYKVIGDTGVLNGYSSPAHMICTISNPVVKKKVISNINNYFLQYAKLIHPTAVISKDVKLGLDTIIQAMCVITTNVEICDHVQLNPQCGIGHDSVVGEHSSLYWNVNISGNVKIGKGCLLGTKSTVLQGLEIADNCTVGANATVTKDIIYGCTAVGTPAKSIKNSEEH